jgi:uncharacterized peroxidase-related enzyme
MSPANSASPAWLSVRPGDSMPGQVATKIGPVAKRIGFVPNVARLLAISPDYFTGWWRYFDELMRRPSGLSKTQREMTAVVVSAEARCPYCEMAHAAALRVRTKDPVLADRLPVNYRHVELAAQGRVMLDFAVKLTHTPEACEKGDVARLRDAGFSDAYILHIIEVTAIFNYYVRLATATGLFPNAEYHTLGPDIREGELRHGTGPKGQGTCGHRGEHRRLVPPLHRAPHSGGPGSRAHRARTRPGGRGRRSHPPHRR